MQAPRFLTLGDKLLYIAVSFVLVELLLVILTENFTASNCFGGIK